VDDPVAVAVALSGDPSISSRAAKYAESEVDPLAATTGTVNAVVTLAEAPAPSDVSAGVVLELNWTCAPDGTVMVTTTLLAAACWLRNGSVKSCLKVKG